MIEQGTMTGSDSSHYPSIHVYFHLYLFATRYKAVYTVLGTEIWTLFRSYPRNSQMTTPITLLHCLVNMVIPLPHVTAFCSGFTRLTHPSAPTRSTGFPRSSFQLSSYPDNRMTQPPKPGLFLEEIRGLLRRKTSQWNLPLNRPPLLLLERVCYRWCGDNSDREAEQE